ncbi:hypothetical protein ACFGVR_21740 [Mucilaginibacter sp. AW1-3]
MRNLLLLLGLLLILANVSCSRTGLKKYYTRISAEEFASYDSTSIIATSKYGVIYHAFTHAQGRLLTSFKVDFWVFEKYDGKKKLGLYKLDPSTELKNDSTLIFYGMPLKVAGDTSNWPKGIWFYQSKKGNESTFQIDSMPKPPLSADPQKLSPGIYLYDAGKFIRLSSSQSEEAFSELERSGFYYLPPPGRFYIVASLKDII